MAQDTPLNRPPIASMRLKPTMGWFGRDPQLEALLVELRASYNLVCVAAFWWDNTLTREYVVLS